MRSTSEAIQQKDEGLFVHLNIVQSGGDASFIAFLQSAQKQQFHINLATVNISESLFLLLQNEYDIFCVKITDAEAPEYERFFANIKFFIDTERDIATILHHLPIEQNNIDDYRIIKGIVSNFTSQYTAPFFKISHNGDNLDINFTHVKNILIKGLEVRETWDTIVETLKSENKYEIYQSIVRERFKKINLYNKGNISEISDIYNMLNTQSQKAFMQVYDLFREVANQQKIAISSVATVTAIEACILKRPQVFDEISSIAGVNKKVLHNAVIRKLLMVFNQTKVEVQRNRAMEMVVDAVLMMQSAEHSIDKNFIASKHEIIAFLGGNLNVDFLKGWKKSIFGDCIVEFLQNKSLLEAKNMKLFISHK